MRKLNKEGNVIAYRYFKLKNNIMGEQNEKDVILALFWEKTRPKIKFYSRRWRHNSKDSIFYNNIVRYLVCIAEHLLLCGKEKAGCHLFLGISNNIFVLQEKEFG